MGLNQAVDHESGRHVDAVLAGIFGVPLHLTIEVGDRKGLGKLHATVALYAPDYVVGRSIKIRPAAMLVEFKFFTMRGNSRHNRLCCCLSAFERRGGQDTAHDHARVHVPGLRLKAELDSDAVLAGLAEQVVKFAECLDGKWAGRFQEHLEDARPVAPDERISAPHILHTIFPPSPGSHAATARRESDVACRKTRPPRTRRQRHRFQYPTGLAPTVLARSFVPAISQVSPL